MVQRGARVSLTGPNGQATVAVEAVLPGTIDFPRHTTYWERTTDLDPHDLDQVGITLETRDTEEGYFVAGVAKKNGRSTVEGVQVGDKLIQVDQLRVAGATRGAIFSALHGRPGTARSLILERAGTQFRLRATVSAF